MAILSTFAIPKSGRLLAIDYGKQRVGLAVTDSLQLIATPLTTVPAVQLKPFLTTYIPENEVIGMIIGWPLDLKGAQTAMTQVVEQIARQLKQAFPAIPIQCYDERFTSKMAVQAMVTAGFRKKQRQTKAEIDQRSAALLLQSFLARW